MCPLKYAIHKYSVMIELFMKQFALVLCSHPHNMVLQLYICNIKIHIMPYKNISITAVSSLDLSCVQN